MRDRENKMSALNSYHPQMGVSYNEVPLQWDQFPPCSPKLCHIVCHLWDHIHICLSGTDCTGSCTTSVCCYPPFIGVSTRNSSGSPSLNVQGLNPVQSGSELIPVSNSGSLSLTGQEALCACRQDSQQQIPQPQQQKP